MNACDMNRPYVFISYSHDPEDAPQVRETVEYFRKKGYNLWTDEDLSVNSRNWKSHVMDVLINPNCKLLCFFRSKSSLTKKTISFEIDFFAHRHKQDNTDHIVIFDLYDSKENEGVYKELLYHTDKEKRDAFVEIREIIQSGANALTFSKSADRDKFENRLKQHECFMQGQYTTPAPSTSPELPEMPEVPGPSTSTATSDSTASPASSAFTAGRQISLDQFDDIAAFELGSIRRNTSSPLMAYVYILDAIVQQYPNVRGFVELKTRPAEHQSYVILPATQLKVRENVHFASILEAVIQKAKGIDYRLYGTELKGLPSEDEVLVHNTGKEAASSKKPSVDAPAKKTSSQKLNRSKEERFSVFGKLHTAKNPTEMMCLVYEELLSKYPESIDQVVAQQPHLSDIDYNDPANEAPTSTFKYCRTLQIGKKIVCIGTNLSTQAKLDYIQKLCALLNLPQDTVRFLNNDETDSDEQRIHAAAEIAASIQTTVAVVETGLKAVEEQPGKSSSKSANKKIKITVFNELFDEPSQIALMGKVYETLLNRYPDKLDEVVAAHDNVFIREPSKEATQMPENTYMNRSKTFYVKDRLVAVGTQYDTVAKVRKFVLLFKTLGIPQDQIKIEVE